MFVISLPNYKTLDQPKCKAFADDKINVTQKLKFGKGKVENIVVKEQNAAPFPTMFSKGLFHRVVKIWDCVVKSYTTWELA